MTVTEITFTLPGIFDAETAFVAEAGSIKAIAVNKTMVITNAKDVDVHLGETIYLFSNVEHATVDEVIDLSDSGIDAEDDKTRAFQLAAQMVLFAGEPGPRAIRFLERVVLDDKFAAHQIEKGETTEVATAQVGAA